MSYWLLNNVADKYHLIFVFANTGQEHEKTLEFVHKCDIEFGFNLYWIEAVIHFDERKASTHKIVDFESASRHGEPFEQMIKKYGIPNTGFPHCTRELKLNPIFSLKQAVGFPKNHPMAVGIRCDEIDRMSPQADEDGIVYPLISWRPTTKAEIRHWWSDQSFDLEIPEHLGNCVTCWKKSDRKLMTIAKHEPMRFNFFDQMEKTYLNAGAGDGGRKFFRNHRSTQDIIATSKRPFTEFFDRMPEWQLNLIVDDLDKEDSCGSACEAQ